MEKTALFAGTFDPYTLGHHSLLVRALPLFDKIIIAIGENNTKKRSSSPKERIDKIQKIYESNKQVTVISYQGLTMDLARECGATVLLRGVRDVKDFEYEKTLADINRNIGNIETLIMITEPQYAYISSTVIRELEQYGKDTSNLLP